MKRKIVYILVLALAVGAMAGCGRTADKPGEEQNELLDPVPTPLPEVTPLPDVNDGVVNDDDGMITGEEDKQSGIAPEAPATTPTPRETVKP